MKKTLLVLALLSPLFLTVTPRKHHKQFKGFNLDAINAYAATALTGSAVFTTDLDKANFVRYYYYLVNGPGAGYSIPNNNMNYLDIVNGYLDGLNTVMSNQGYATCADIPTSGSFTGSFNGQTFNVALTAGSKTVPSTYPNDAGATYDKKVLVSTGGSNYLEIQLKCPTSGTRMSGYILMGSQAVSQGTMYEAMFQMDAATNLTYLDMVVWVASNKMFINRFSTSDGVSYKLYSLFLWMGNYSAVAINGTAGGKTNFNTFYTNSNSTTTYSTTINDITGINNDMNQSAYNACLDMASNASTTGCTTISAPGALTLHGTSYNFNFSSMASLTTSTMP